MTTHPSRPDSLESVLAQAVDAAGITGRVVVPGGSSSPALRLLGPRRLPFALTVQAARKWLADHSIAAAAEIDEADELVITPHGGGAVHRLIDRLLSPAIRAGQAAEQLWDALGRHDLTADVSVADTGRVTVELRDSDLESAVALCALLGAEDIGDGLRLHRPRGMHQLATRMGLLLTGAVGRGVTVEADPGCAHADAGVRVGLSVEQASQLAGKIAARPVSGGELPPDGTVFAPHGPVPVQIGATSPVSLLADGGALGDDYTTKATSAGLYDFLLGGVDHYEPDRAAGRDIHETAKWIKTAALINRAFTLRSVEFSLGLGVRQFLDLGCGLPASANVHEITDRTGVALPVVYVDRDPGVYAHAKCRLDGRDGVTVIQADILAMDQLLACEAMRAGLDLDQPVAVLAHGVLHWCPDDAAVTSAMAALRAWMPVGSTLSISHLTDHWHPATMPEVVATYARHGLDVRPRSREAILEDLFGDFTQQERGLTATGRWGAPGPHALRPEEHSAAFAGIAVKPASRSPRLIGPPRGRGAAGLEIGR
ncbi:SAM-dependent methyltransferase [Streptomyces sp. NPDC056672]|uniref:SAM-dependent methyltransferase n=1 Tax=Streptomyces sp. NPDC056672 TaxID=3345906 RepID=UPI0036BD6442